MPTTVTLLFTDLVSSTELLSRVGDERNDQLRREHFAILRDALQEYGGREVKNLGDGLMAAFDGATNALVCACEMQQRLAMRNRVAGEPLTVRIGIATGEATLEDDDYFGVPVVEAARLCAHARSEEILATAVVRALAGTRSGLAFDDVGPVRLKGLDGLIDVVRVVWTATTRAWQSSLPARLTRTSNTLFVGRAEQLSLLADAAADAFTHARQRVALVEGEAGIGKTALVSVVGTTAHEQGVVVLYGHHDEDLGIPYQAWGEALADLVTSAPESLLRAHVEARGGDLVTLVPNLRDRVPDVPAPRSSDIDAERHLLFGAVVDLLRRASTQAPVVLVLDDLHWADRESVQLLRHVVAASVALPMLIIGTYRGSDVGAGHPMTELLATLHREDLVVRLPLRGLDDEDVLRIMETAAGHAMDDTGKTLRDELLAETDGNPFFIIEILRHLAETGAIMQQPDGRWIADVGMRGQGLPVSVREVVGRRVAALGQSALRVLSVAAVIGREFDVDVLGGATGTDPDTLLDILDEATRAAVVRHAPERPDGYAFVHALIQRSLYDDLSPARRRREHERVAEALEAQPDGTRRLGELARHWYEAVRPTSVAKAYAAAIAAGEEARRRLAPTDATRWFQQALDLAPNTEHPQRSCADALLRLGEAQRLSGNPAYRDTLLQAADVARKLGDGDRLAAAALANTRGFASVVGEVDRGRIEALQAALASPRLPAPTRARLLAQLSYETHYAADVDTQALIDEALALTEELDDEDARAAALRAFHLYFIPSTLGRRIATLDEYEQLATRGDALRRVHMAMSVVPAFFQSGDMRGAVTYLERLRAAAEELGDPSAFWVHSWLANIPAMVAGDVTAAEELANQALQYGTEAGEPDAFQFWGAQITSVRMAQGRVGEILAGLKQAADIAPGIPVLRTGVALGYALTDNFAEARRELDEYCATSLADRFAESPLRLAALGALGNAASRIGHGEACKVLVPLLAPYRDQVFYAGVSVAGPIAMTLGSCELVIGDHDASEADFQLALAMSERMSAPFWIAFVKLEWARLLASRAPERARHMLREARDVARTLGLAELTRAADSVASDLGHT